MLLVVLVCAGALETGACRRNQARRVWLQKQQRQSRQGLQQLQRPRATHPALGALQAQIRDLWRQQQRSWEVQKPRQRERRQ